MSSRRYEVQMQNTRSARMTLNSIGTAEKYSAGGVHVS
jgi:hypothetical protein